MPIALGLPTGYPYVLAAATGAFYLNIWQTVLVSSARKASGINYPRVYATDEEAKSSEDANKFNCIQRAHQNSLELQTIFVTSTLISGLRFPRLTTGLALTYLVGRVLYTLGYSSGEPTNRATGAKISIYSLLPIVFTSTYTIFQFLAESDFQI